MHTRAMLIRGTLAAVVATCCAASIGFATAREAGEMPPGEAHAPQRVVTGGRALYGAWRQAAASNRVLIHLGTHLHFVEVDTNDGYSATLGRALAARSLLPQYEANVGLENYIWVATQTNLFREVRHVFPRAAFERRRQLLAEVPNLLHTGEDEFLVYAQDTPRYFSAALPDCDERVALNIDASYLEDITPEALARTLADANLDIGQLTLNLAEDDPTVSARARARITALADLLRD